MEIQKNVILTPPENSTCGYAHTYFRADGVLEVFVHPVVAFDRDVVEELAGLAPPVAVAVVVPPDRVSHTLDRLFRVVPVRRGQPQPVRFVRPFSPVRRVAFRYRAPVGRSKCQSPGLHAYLTVLVRRLD